MVCTMVVRAVLCGLVKNQRNKFVNLIQVSDHGLTMV